MPIYNAALNQTNYNPYGLPYEGSAFASAPIPNGLVKSIQGPIAP